MVKPTSKLGPLETNFFSWIQLNQLDQITTSSLVDAFGITPKQERELLSRLERKSLIVRLKRGLYLVPQTLPPGGKWAPNEYILVHRLMESVNAAYQIGGPTAFHYHGLDEQVPNRTYVYNNKLSGSREIAGLQFYFIKTDEKRLGATEQFKVKNNIRIRISDLSRTLVDAVNDWHRYNSLPRAYDWIRNRIGDPDILNRLVKSTIRYGNIGCRRRLGFFLKQIGVSQKFIKKIKNTLNPTKKLISFLPNRKAKGSTDRDWGLIING